MNPIYKITGKLANTSRKTRIVASGAVGLVIAIRIAGFLTLLARTVGNPSYDLSLGVSDAFSVTVSYPGPVNSATVYHSAYFAASAFGSGRPGAYKTLRKAVVYGGTTGKIRRRNRGSRRWTTF